MKCRLVALMIVFCCLLSGQNQARSRDPSQDQRAVADYVQEVNQLVNDSGRADLSDREADKQRQHARELAAQYAATVKASNPTGIDRLYLGYLYQLADDKQNAVAAFRNTLNDASLIEERKQQAHLLLIRNLAQLGRMEEAEAALRAIPTTAFNSSETHTSAHETLAIAYTEREEMERALRHQERAAAAARGSGVIPRIWLTGRSLAQLYVALGRKTEGIKLLNALKAFFVRQVRLTGGQLNKALQTAVAQMDVALAQAAMLDKPAPKLSAAKWIKEAPHTKLSALRGKVVLLELWAAWCPDCRGMIPHLRDWHAQYTSRGLKILPVTQYYGYNGREVNKASPAQEEAFLLRFKQMHNIPYGTGLDPQGAPSFMSYHVRSIPQIVIIDRAGTVRFIFTWHTNPALCEYMIKRLLAEPVASG